MPNATHVSFMLYLPVCATAGSVAIITQSLYFCSNELFCVRVITYPRKQQNSLRFNLNTLFGLFMSYLKESSLHRFLKQLKIPLAHTHAALAIQSHMVREPEPLLNLLLGRVAARPIHHNFMIHEQSFAVSCMPTIRDSSLFRSDLPLVEPHHAYDLQSYSTLGFSQT